MKEGAASSLRARRMQAAPRAARAALRKRVNLRKYQYVCQNRCRKEGETDIPQGCRFLPQITEKFFVSAKNFS